jgi:hypothetical protein
MAMANKNMASKFAKENVKVPIVSELMKYEDIYM